MSDDTDMKRADAPSGSAGQAAANVMHRAILAVVHDLNNPLSIIAGNAQLLGEIAQARNLGEDIQDPLRDIERAVEQMSAQLERLSELSRSTD